MSWLEDIQNHRKRQVNQMVKAFGCDEMDLQKAEDDGVDYTVDEPEEEGTSKTSKKKNTGKSNMYKMKMLGLRKFNDQDQKTYIGVEDADNSYITNLDNGDIIISKTDEGYLVSKFPIDENKEGEEKEATGLSEAIDIALQFKEELDNEEDNPEQIMYKDTEKAFEDEVNPFEKAAYEAEFGQDIEKAKHQDGDMHPNGKWVWRSFANGGKGDWRVASPSKRGGGAKTTAASSDDGKKKNSLDTYLENQKKMQQIGKKTLPSDAKKIMDALKTNNSKYSDSSKVTVEATPKGNWRLYYDGKDTGINIKGSVLSEDTIRDLNWEHHDVDNASKKKEPKAKKPEKPSYESKSASDYDKGDGKVGNYPVPTHTSYSAANLYNRLKNNRHFGFKYGLPEEEIMKKLKDYKGNVKVSEHNNAGTIEIYRIKFI